MAELGGRAREGPVGAWAARASGFRAKNPFVYAGSIFACDAKPYSELKQRIRQKECAMKMKSAQVERTLSQFKARAIPDDHPVVPQLNSLFGDHTFFLDSDGLSVVEPTEFTQSGDALSGTVVKLAIWNDPNLTSLAPQEPELTDIVVELGTEH
jgi:hypothetical protein